MSEAHARGAAHGLSFGAWHGVSAAVYVTAPASRCCYGLEAGSSVSGRARYSTPTCPMRCTSSRQVRSRERIERGVAQRCGRRPAR